MTIVHPRVLDAAAAAALVDSVISAASRRGPFVVRLGEVLVLPPDHVALAVVVGGDVLAALRDELLPGVRTIDDDRPYVPHVTVGRVDPDDTFVVAARAAALLRGGDEALVDELLVESFAEDGASFIEARAAMLAAAP